MLLALHCKLLVIRENEMIFLQIEVYINCIYLVIYAMRVLFIKKNI